MNTNMQIEVNPKPIAEPILTEEQKQQAGFQIRPPTPDFWLVRVPVSDKQAIVAFPKMSTLGIGFQYEPVEKGANSPYLCSPERVLETIGCNRGDNSITDEHLLKAIKLLQSKCHALQGTDPNDTPLEKKAEEFSKKLGGAMAGLVLGAALMAALMGGEESESNENKGRQNKPAPPSDGDTIAE